MKTENECILIMSGAKVVFLVLHIASHSNAEGIIKDMLSDSLVPTLLDPGSVISRNL